MAQAKKTPIALERFFASDVRYVHFAVVLTTFREKETAQLFSQTTLGKDMATPVESPAERLEGTTLSSGWEIYQKVVKPKGASGGNFGTSYLARRGKQTAFVKALDFRRAFHETDFVAALNQLTSEVLWEKSLMELCTTHSMSRVISLLDYEDIILPADAGDPTKRVSCLVLEVGDGDLRRRFDLTAEPRRSWRLRVLRDVALALDQLHRKGVAHLDVKPSNVISVGASSVLEMMKLSDLGRSVRKGTAGPFDLLPWPGDRAYQPPEKWYNFNCSQWNDEREAADAYLLGSLFVYLFTGVAMNNLLFNEAPQAFWPGVYRGQFDSQLIDVLRLAQTKALAIHVFPELPEAGRGELEAMLVELTNPDPTKRGDPNARKQGQVGIDRYHQKFLRISRRLEIEERKQA